MEAPPGQDLLTPVDADAHASARPGRRPFGAVDKLMVGYLCLAGVVLLAFRRSIPAWEVMFAAHAAGVAAIVLAAGSASPGWRWFRDWYPLPYIFGCYKEMSVFITALRGRETMDAALARLDAAMFVSPPSVWVQRLEHPYLTESLQIVYVLFFPALVTVYVLLARKRDTLPAQYYAFLLTLGFLTSYVGYFIVPALGPRVWVKDSFATELTGVWTFASLRGLLDTLEGHYCDCFPSGHTQMTVIAWWFSRHVSARFRAGFTAYACCLIFATVYLRYHYVVDVIAGVIVAAALLAAGPYLFRLLAAPHERAAPANP